MTSGPAWIKELGLFQTATCVVLSNDAPAVVKAAARVAKVALGDCIQICDGVDDDEQVQAAHDALPADGGSIELSEGVFWFSTGVTFTKLVHLRGQGVFNTKIRIVPGSDIGAIVLNLSDTQHPFSMISEMTFRGCGVETNNHMIRLQNNCQDTRLTDLYIHGHGNMSGGTGAAISVEHGWDHHIERVVVESNGSRGIITAYGTSGTITNTNIVENKTGIEITRSMWHFLGGKIALSAQHNVLLTNPQRFEIRGTQLEDAGGKTGAVTLNTYDDIHITTDGVNQIFKVLITDILWSGAYNVAGSTRYGIYIDRNGLVLTSDFISISNVHFASFGTGPIGFADAGSWTKRLRMSNLSGVWGIWDRFNVSEIKPKWNDATPTLGGTGAVAGLDTWVRVNTGANINSDATAYSQLLMGISSNGDTDQRYDGIYYDQPLLISFEVARELAGDNPTSYVQIKRTAVKGDLADKGLGIKIIDLAAWAEAHDGVNHTLTDMAFLFTSAAAVHKVDILFIPGQMIVWLVDGDAKVIQTTNLPAGAAAATNRLVASIETVNAGNAQLLVSDVIIKHLGNY